MSNLPPGFRFYPTEEELVGFYLHNKLEKKREEVLNCIIPVVDIYDLDPWNLPLIAEVCHGDSEWFFFCPRQEREAHGGRPNRIAPSGYWKASGSPGSVFSSSNRVIGVRKSMVFYKGKAPTGEKTKWKLIEYRALEEEATTLSIPPKLRLEFSLCRVYVKSGSRRSFDRRPSVASTSGTTDTLKDKMVCGAEDDHQAVQMENVNVGSSSEGVFSGNHLMVEKTSLHDSSSSADDHLGPSIDLMMADDLDDFWESLDTGFNE